MTVEVYGQIRGKIYSFIHFSNKVRGVEFLEVENLKI